MADIQRRVLMADDDEEDCFLAHEAFKASGARVDFSCVGDGMELMARLSERSPSGTDELPDLILLDLNMPCKDGRECLVDIKRDARLDRIPVVILTTSAEDEDISFLLSAGADAFITKPPTFDELIEIVKSLVEKFGFHEKDHA